MAARNFEHTYGNISNKQCIIAYDLHRECLSDLKTSNPYLCPDTYEAYKHWCPPEIHMRKWVIARATEDYVKGR